jgi:hypothetical protein
LGAQKQENEKKNDDFNEKSSKEFFCSLLSLLSHPLTILSTKITNDSKFALCFDVLVEAKWKKNFVE